MSPTIKAYTVGWVEGDVGDEDEARVAMHRMLHELILGTKPGDRIALVINGMTLREDGIMTVPVARAMCVLHDILAGNLAAPRCRKPGCKCSSCGKSIHGKRVD